MNSANLGLDLLRDIADATPEQTVRKVKNVAAAELAKLDPSAAIRFTDYFNHTYVPDIVMQWPQEGTVAQRFVYLRLSDRADELVEDVQNVGEQRPVVLSVTPPQEPQAGIEVEGVQRLAQVATLENTLVSDLGGLDALGGARDESAFVGILTSTVARGGRGLLTPDSARVAASSIDAGFVGAQTLDADAVAKAAGVSTLWLSDAHAAKLNRFLQAVWIGAGGRTDLYPGEVQELGGDLDDDSWNFLLTLPVVGDLDFWKRLGRTLTISQLARLDADLGAVNFHNLVKANTDFLWARNAVVVDEQPNLLDENVADQWKWTVDRGTLALSGPTFVCHLAEKKADLEGVDGTKANGLGVSELRDRATGHRVTGVVMSDEQSDLDLASRVREDVTTSAWLNLLAAGGRGPSVKRATTVLRSGHTVNLDFVESTASAATRSQPTIPAFTEGILPLLRRMSEEDISGLRGCFSGEDSYDIFALLTEDVEEVEAAGDEPRTGDDSPFDPPF